MATQHQLVVVPLNFAYQEPVEQQTWEGDGVIWLLQQVVSWVELAVVNLRAEEDAVIGVTQVEVQSCRGLVVV